MRTATWAQGWSPAKASASRTKISRPTSWRRSRVGRSHREIDHAAAGAPLSDIQRHHGLLSPIQTLSVDIIDYPGEWLLDLPLVETSFEQLSRSALALARTAPRDAIAQEWLQCLETGDRHAIINAYRRYLERCQHELGLSFIQPGRLVHGFEDLPEEALFAPLPAATASKTTCNRLSRTMWKRWSSPSTKEHFSRFDRQIVLVDLFSCLNSGPAWFEDSMTALETILESSPMASRAGSAGSWHHGSTKSCSPQARPIMVAANQHPNLKHLLELMIAPAARRARFEGSATTCSRSRPCVARTQCRPSIKASNSPAFAEGSSPRIARPCSSRARSAGPAHRRGLAIRSLPFPRFRPAAAQAPRPRAACAPRSSDRISPG